MRLFPGSELYKEPNPNRFERQQHKRTRNCALIFSYCSLSLSYYWNFRSPCLARVRFAPLSRRRILDRQSAYSQQNFPPFGRRVALCSTRIAPKIKYHSRHRAILSCGARRAFAPGHFVGRESRGRRNSGMRNSRFGQGAGMVSLKCR